MIREFGGKKESISQSMYRIYNRISGIEPSSSVLSIITVVIAVFLLGGGVYNIVVQPLPSIYYGDQFIFLYPQLNEQFITDSIVAMIMYSVGALGLVVMYRSTKSAFKPRQAYYTLLSGVILLLLAYIFLEVTINLKIG